MIVEAILVSVELLGGKLCDGHRDNLSMSLGIQGVDVMEGRCDCINQLVERVELGVAGYSVADADGVKEAKFQYMPRHMGTS